jgi:hypothetical protein
MIVASKGLLCWKEIPVALSGSRRKRNMWMLDVDVMHGE